MDCGPGDAGTTVQWKGDAPDCLSAKLRHHQSGSPGSGPLTNPTPAEPLPFSLLPRRLTLRRTSSSRRLRAAISPHFDPGTYAVSRGFCALHHTAAGTNQPPVYFFQTDLGSHAGLNAVVAAEPGAAAAVSEQRDPVAAIHPGASIPGVGVAIPREFYGRLCDDHVGHGNEHERR